MNCSPMMRRFCSGSATPARAARNRSDASTWRSGTLKCSSNASTTWPASSLRRTPWSPRTHVSCSPTARCTGNAARPGWRPPERAELAWSWHARGDPARERAAGLVLAGLLADQVDLLLADLQRRTARRRLTGVEHQVAQDVGAAWRVRLLGMELDGEEAAAAVFHRRDRRGV